MSGGGVAGAAVEMPALLSKAHRALPSDSSRGGVMLVHNSRKNETRVIDFRETAPSGLQEEMLYTNLELKVRHWLCRQRSDDSQAQRDDAGSAASFLFPLAVVVIDATLLLLLLTPFSLACWWEFRARSVGCIRPTSSTEGTHTFQFPDKLPYSLNVGASIVVRRHVAPQEADEPNFFP